MSKKVYANGMEIAAKAGAGKVVAAFPDVCPSPPSPPAGPVPVPYPDSSFVKDLKEGSSSVKVGGQPVALRDTSYYQTAPLGNEAATRTFGGSFISHTISGKTYFAAWSMDVQFEGKNVVRHLDLTTSNHGSYPGSTPPVPNLAGMITTAQARISAGLCPCCGKKDCPAAFEDGEEAVSFEDFYGLNETNGKGELTERAVRRRREYRILLGAKAHECTCQGRVFPEAPCDVFRMNFGRTKESKARWEDASPDYRAEHKVPSGTKINHLTPKSAGGCPDAEGNLQPHELLCDVCKAIDDAFTSWQGNGNDEWKATLQDTMGGTSIRKYKNFVPAHW